MCLLSGPGGYTGQSLQLLGVGVANGACIGVHLSKGWWWCWWMGSHDRGPAVAEVCVGIGWQTFQGQSHAMDFGGRGVCSC